MSFEDFLEMGGYARFVWPAFAVTAVTLAGLLVASVRSLRSQEASLARLQRTSNRQRLEVSREA